MIVLVTLNTEDPELIDSEDETGLSEQGYSQLLNAISSAGFEVVMGPDQANL